ncbi:MAG: hypothetical protein JNN32_06960 [Flavobacteriales bacterium]|nr:hypothetical protein [Flavobacteriales bacterium]
MKAKHLWMLIALLAITAATIFYIQWKRAGSDENFSRLYKPYVVRSEYDCVSSDFGRYFMSKENNARGTLEGNVQVNLNSFTTRLKNVLDNYEHDDHGVIIHHGLERVSAGVFRYWPEIEFVGLEDIGKDLWDTVQLPGQRFSVNLGTGELTPRNNIDEWMNYKTYMHRYTTNTDAVNDPTFQKASPVIEGLDVQHYLFRYNNRLEKFLNQNKGLDPTHIRITSICEPTEHDGDIMRGLRHYIALAMFKSDLGPSGTLLVDEDDDSIIDRYKNKALDVGSPCPYRCATAEVPDHGIPVRKSCTK